MDVRANLEAGKYENTVPYSITEVPVDENKMTVREAREHKEREKQRARDQRRLHGENESRMNKMLRDDLETEHGVVGHPKTDLLWTLAWDHGHSSGYGEVITYYEQFVELIQ